MRLCACLWGGLFNPIIPVCQRLPQQWRRDGWRLRGTRLTAGYLRFFEPDVYVEASPGLASKAGLEDSDSSIGERRVVALDDFVRAEHERWPEVAFGLEIFDLYRYLYEREYRFVPRDERRIALFEGAGRDLAFTEAAFGGFPDDELLSHIPRGYVEAFEPARFKPTAASWLEVMEQRFLTPLHFTRHALDVDYRAAGGIGPTLFVVDPSSSLDLIDLWNLRQFRRTVLPVNIHWMSETSDFLRDFIEKNYRPVPGNPHGVMIDTTVQFARSISESRAEAICNTVLGDLTRGAWAQKSWYDQIWYDDQDERVIRPRRASLSAATKSLELSIDSDDANSVRFRSLSPDFAGRFSGGAARWINVFTAIGYNSHEGLALVLPSHLEDPHDRRIRLRDPLIASREGWVLPQCWVDHDEYLRLPRGRDAICSWLQRQGIEATPSDAGRVAEQLLASVQGFWGARLFADAEILKLLDKMSRRVRKRSDGTVEEYPDRTASVETWRDLLKRRANQRRLPEWKLDDFIRAGALRLGLSIRCPNCEKQNWYGLNDLAVRVQCARCLQEYDFPQGSLDFNMSPWRYRLAGPYSVPHYAGGGYATILTLRVFAGYLDMSGPGITYSTNLDLDINGVRAEVDFALWYQRHRWGDTGEEPAFVIGEAKSFATEAIQEKDVERLRVFARRLPGTFLVFAVLKDALSEDERVRLRKLALWGRVPLPDGRPRAPVIVLTGIELFAAESLRWAWQERGGIHAQLARSQTVHLDSLRTLSDLTQQFYLDLESYDSWLRARLQARRAKKK